MGIRIVLALIVIAALVTVGCASGATTGTLIATPTPGVTQKPTTTESKPGIIHPTWVTAQVEGNVVSIPLSDVNSGKMIHFEVTNQGTKMAFMSYQLGDKIYLRASVCPPCRSRGFSLVEDVLDCENCHTKFKASTGEGISGACVNYPKAEVAHAISGDYITMTMDNLTKAYADTLELG
ncbi:MAG TPA: Fe-S-containing protein [Dehalococcoidia bacterium]|nr:Fe-S-containing protein [Dehalococcoidia bacterium]